MQQNKTKQFIITADILASHSQRFLNLLIDTAIQFFLFFIVLVFMVANAQANGDKTFITNFETNTVLQYSITIAIALFYYNVFEIIVARTVGKYVTQTIVVDKNGEKPNSDTILVRSLCRLIPFNAFSFLFISGRGWHDTISKTYVVNKKLLDEKKRLFYNADLRSSENA
jgi:uncharacterized RDD family membrane protein YckC